jgi:hypothetical protein
MKKALLLVSVVSISIEEAIFSYLVFSSWRATGMRLDARPVFAGVAPDCISGLLSILRAAMFSCASEFAPLKSAAMRISKNQVRQEIQFRRPL